VILSFSAAPSDLPVGGGDSMLTWQVQNATSLSIDNGLGTLAGNSMSVHVAATTIFTLTATNSHGISRSTTAVVIGQNPAQDHGRNVAMVAPTGGETFAAPATLRLVAIAYDPNVSTNTPSEGLGGNASKVQFMVDDAVVLEVDGTNAEYWIFKGFTSGVANGLHRVWARAIYTSPDEVLDSPPMIVTVADPPTYARTISLDGDVVLSGGMGYEIAGAPGQRVRLDGNGHKIVSSGDTSGPLTLEFVDVFNLGDATDTTGPSMQVTTSGTVTIEDSTFDTSNTLRISQSGSGTASVRRNLFRSNMRMPIGQNPGSGVDKPSFPVASFGGGSTGAKVFAGNNVGAGWVEFESANNWTVGGDTDADSNVLIGPRVGIYAQMSSNIQIRHNYSHHVYYGGWSQGSNFELGGSTSTVVEHNVVYGSSWPVRGVGCEFRYNLVLEAGHEWLWADSSDGSIHHNIFAGGAADIAGIYVLYDPQNVSIFNNTIDGQLGPDIVTAVLMTGGQVSLTSNLFMNVTRAPTITITGGSLSSDYNMFFDPQTTNYSDGRRPGHDVAGGAETDGMLAAPPSVPFDLDETGVWNRTTSVHAVLYLYRMRYTPAAGSPVFQAGDPAGGAGNDVGAVGADSPHNSADKFGLF
jgi:hypothetical protein